MEDLTLRGAHFPNATSEVPLDSIRDLIANLARLYAGFWQSRRLEIDLAWLRRTACRAGGSRFSTASASS